MNRFAKNSKDPNNPPLEFPVSCHYRIISLDLPDIQNKIKLALEACGVSSELKSGNISNKAKYVSFYIDIEVHSKEMLNDIHQRLTAIDGVKMVL